MITIKDELTLTDLKHNLNVVCDLLDKVGCKYTVAGGFARDLYFGVTPKDVDIIIYKNPQHGAGLFSYEELPESISSYIEDVLDVPNCYTCLAYHLQEGNTNQTTSDRLDMVFKMPGTGVDVIFYNKCDTEQDVVDNFDCNLNQFGYDRKMDNSFYIGRSSLAQFRLVREDASDARIDYMLNKYMNYAQLFDKAAWGL